MISCSESIGQPLDNFLPKCHKNIKWLHGALIPQLKKKKNPKYN
jgi:hypothetical protein